MPAPPMPSTASRPPSIPSAISWSNVSNVGIGAPYSKNNSDAVWLAVATSVPSTSQR